MPDILHGVGVKSSPKETYRALSTRDGLAGWWATDTQGDCNIPPLLLKSGKMIGLRIEQVAKIVLDPAKRVLWQVVGGPADWIGTKVSFDLRPDDDATIVLFKHQGWKEPIEFMHHCSTKWAVFLLSLKSLLETGKGAPYPNEIKLDSWE